MKIDSKYELMVFVKGFLAVQMPNVNNSLVSVLLLILVNPFVVLDLVDVMASMDQSSRNPVIGT